MANEIVQVIGERIASTLRIAQDDLQKAFSLLGNTYAPFFFSLSVVLGCIPVLLLWQSGDFFNAFLGARGIGVVTSELSKSMWSIAILFISLQGTLIALYKLEGKLLSVFLSLASWVTNFFALIFLIDVPLFFFVHIAHILALAMTKKTMIRLGIFISWFFILTFLFFHIVESAALRTITLGQCMIVIGMSTYIFILHSAPHIARRK